MARVSQRPSYSFFMGGLQDSGAALMHGQHGAGPFRLGGQWRRRRALQRHGRENQQ